MNSLRTEVSLISRKDGIVTVDASINRNGRDYVIKLPPKLGEKLHRQTLSVAITKKE